MGDVIDVDFGGREPVLRAGTNPLPYVQVGMVVCDRADPSNMYRVTQVYESECIDATLCKLVTVGEWKVLSVHNCDAIRRWELAEDFDPNGCPECGCTSVPCGCSDE